MTALILVAFFSCIDCLISYRCSDGNCISVSLLCDFHLDCLHGEDEECCEYLTNLTSSAFIV